MLRAELEPISLNGDMWLRAVKFTDGTQGILLVVEIGERRYAMVMTEVEALIESGKLETEGFITICDVEAEPFPMYLDPKSAHQLAAGLRTAANRLSMIAELESAQITGSVQ